MAKSPKPSKASKKRAAPKNPQGDTMATQEVQVNNMAAQNAPGDVGVQEGGSISSEVIVQGKTESRLLKLPAEIKQKIWILAITVDEPIEPVQLRERSNKFVWSRAQARLDGQHKITVEDAPPLTVVELSRVCRALYEEVSLTHLFYKVNRFQFGTVHRASDLGMVTYLVALTTPRMQALRSITCDWPMKWEASKDFAVLATCAGLQNLKLILHGSMLWSNQTVDIAKVPGFKESLIVMEGLQSIDLKLCKQCCDSYRGVGRLLIDKLEPLLKERMKHPRGTSKCNHGAYLAAQQEAKLDILGDGRLGEDKKPGIIASRTRHQLRKLENLADDGTIPKRVIAKYDADGDLAWGVCEVMDSRRSEPDGFPPSVEFKLKCMPLTGPRNWNFSDLPAETSWEDINALSNCRGWILEFYRKNPGSYGMEAVIEAWELRDQDSGKTAKERKALRATTDSLIVLANRQAKIEERQAERAAKLAAIQARKVAQAAKRARKCTKKAKTAATA